MMITIIIIAPMIFYCFVIHDSGFIVHESQTSLSTHSNQTAFRRWQVATPARPCAQCGLKGILPPKLTAGTWTCLLGKQQWSISQQVFRFQPFPFRKCTLPITPWVSGKNWGTAHCGDVHCWRWDNATENWRCWRSRYLFIKHTSKGSWVCF